MNLSEKLDSALKLLAGETTTLEKFQSVNKLLKGAHPRIDTHLQKVSSALSQYEKLAEGNLIELTTENLREKTEKDKKRKKALLLLIRSWNDLKSEVNRIRQELNHNQGQNQAIQYGKIIKFAKGPLGIITLIAVLIVGFSLFKPSSQQNSNTNNTVTSPSITQNNKPKIKVIIFNGKQIPLTQLRIGQGPECLDGTTESPHYHAHSGVATGIDGTPVTDPGSCGFGKVKDVKVTEI